MAVRFTLGHGDWPDNWPEELEPLRERSTTTTGFDLFSELHQDYYEIPLYSRSEVDRIWPSILKVRSKGSPITAGRLNSGSDDPEPVATIRIYVAPAMLFSSPPLRDEAGNTLSSERVDLWVKYTRHPDKLTSDELAVLAPEDLVGKLHIDRDALEKLRASGQFRIPELLWPDSVLEADGTLPECVYSPCGIDNTCEWRNCGDTHPGMCVRARVEVELRIDEDEIDFKEIDIPADAEVIDKFRFGF
jgi:hypothetical protein